jgi:hypothetical protein
MKTIVEMTFSAIFDGAKSNKDLKLSHKFPFFCQLNSFIPQEGVPF